MGQEGSLEIDDGFLDIFIGYGVENKEFMFKIDPSHFLRFLANP